MSPERTAFLIFIIPLLIVFFLFKRKVSYFWAPYKVISYGKQKNLGAIHFFFTLFLALGLHVAVNNLFDLDEKLEDKTIARIVMILSELIISASLIGILIDKYLASSNPEFKAWKKQRLRRKKN